MKINIQNNQPFKGLNLTKVNPEDIKRVIVPCVKGLERLAKKADITIESTTILQKFKNYQTPKSALNISVIPFDTLNAKVAISNYSMLITNKNIKNHTLVELIRESI